MKKTTLPDFSEKLISVTLSTGEYSLAVNSPKWKIEGGRLFLVGVVQKVGLLEIGLLAK
jgi:hypothetical protein